MRYGIVSDIHANIQAWNAVLRDMKKIGVDSILCLGDVVGYGPNPAEVMDSCYKHCDYFILGNHDAVIGNRLDSNLFNDNAKFLIEWTRDQLSPLAADFFGDMPLRMEGPGFLCAHGELAMPGRFGYIYEAKDAIESFTSNDSPLMFIGHTHFPARFTFDLQSNQVTKDLDVDFRLNPDQRYMINAGSVGDPRDGQVTASYCVYDAETQEVFFRKVPFDVNGFRENLVKTQLPVNPFFLRVLDGQTNEAETIKDMQTLERAAAAKAAPKVQKINQENSGKKKRQKLSFSSDTLAETRERTAQQSGRRSEEKTSGDKTKKLIGIIAVAFTLLLIVVMLVVRQSMTGEEASPVVDGLKETVEIVKKEVVVQYPGRDLYLGLETAKYPISLLANETSGFLEGWSNLDDKISWKIRITTPGWYELQLENIKSGGNAEVQGRIGEVVVKGNIEAHKGLEFSSVGKFEIKRSFTGHLNLSCLSNTGIGDDILSLKSVKLKYLGKEKPRNKVFVQDELLTDFEGNIFPTGWMTDSVTFGYQPLTSKTLFPGVRVQGFSGKGLVGTSQRFYESMQTAGRFKGLLISPEFELRHHYVNLLAAGSGGSEDLIILSENGKLLSKMRLPALSNNRLVPVHWDISEYIGKTVQITVKDGGNSPVYVDRIFLTDKDSSEFSTLPLNGDITGDPLQVVEQESSSKFGNVASRLYEKDFAGAIDALKSLNADQTYVMAVQSLMNFENKIMSSYKESEGKIINDFVGRAAGKKYKVQIVSASESELKIRTIIDNTAKKVTLTFNQLSNEEIKKRSAKIVNGDAAYLIFCGANKSSSRETPKIESLQLRELLNLTGQSSRSSLRPNIISGNRVKIILRNMKEIENLKIRFKDGNAEKEVFARYENVTELVPQFSRAGYTDVDPMKIAVFDLPNMMNLDRIQISGNGSLKAHTLLVMDDNDNIVWQKSHPNKKSILKNGLIVNFNEFFNHPPAENLALNKTFKTNDKSSSGHGLVDGIWSTRLPFTFATGNSIVFPKEVILDLEETVLANALRLGSTNSNHSYDTEISVSLDGVEFKEIGRIYSGTDKVYRYTSYFEEQEIRYVKIKFISNVGQNQKNNTDSCFIDELEVFRFQ